MTRATPVISALGAALGAALGVPGCQGDRTPVEATDTTGQTSAEDAGSSTGIEPPKETATITHSFGLYSLEPAQEIQPCIQWTIDNVEPLYVQAATLANDGGYHHSNWFVLPEEAYPGPDGFFDCDERNFTEFEAALAGTVLTAQSTQSRYERMALPEGVVVKIPPQSKILGGAHLLNLADAVVDTELRLSLELVHPRDVEVVAAPFRLSYYDLYLPAYTESRFTAECDFDRAYDQAADMALDLKLYYVLPHYHYLGNHFDLTISGGPRDGQSVFRLEGFNADANGQVYADPVDLTGADGFRFTCGYDNWTDRNLGWGVGQNEMCVMLGLADSAVVLDGSVIQGTGQVVGTNGEILLNEGPCYVTGLDKDDSQGMPTEAELESPLYVPPVDPNDVDLLPVDECLDTPADAVPSGAATLSRVHDTLLVSTCQFSSCHAGSGSAAGLDLAADDLYTELMEHQVVAATDLPLVAPGNPEGSWLYRLVSECEPTDRDGDPVVHMPLNSPRLSDPAQVALLRDWIAAGATDN